MSGRDGEPRVRLVAFDLDGTLVRGNTAAKCLPGSSGPSGTCGRSNRWQISRDRESIRLLRDEAAMDYRGVTITELRSHLCSLMSAPGAREAFGLLRRFGVATAIVTMTWAFAAEWMAQELGADHYVGTRLLDDGSEEPFWPEDKATWLQGLMRRRGVRRDEAGAIGDSWLDVPMLGVVGQAIYVGPTVKATRCPLNIC